MNWQRLSSGLILAVIKIKVKKLDEKGKQKVKARLKKNYVLEVVFALLFLAFVLYLIYIVGNF